MNIIIISADYNFSFRHRCLFCSSTQTFRIESLLDLDLREPPMHGQALFLAGRALWLSPDRHTYKPTSQTHFCSTYALQLSASFSLELAAALLAVSADTLMQRPASTVALQSLKRTCSLALVEWLPRAVTSRVLITGQTDKRKISMMKIKII